MTIEAQAAVLPAGWYTDPGESGGKRWWDGIKWTQHLQMPVTIAPPSAASRPTPNPYGLNGVSSAPHAPSTGESSPVANTNPARPLSNRSAWLALVFGAVSIGLSVATTLPGPQVAWVGGAGVIAVLLAIRSLSGLRSGASTIVWAPVIGVVLALLATASMALGVSVSSLVSSIAPQASTTAPTPAAIAALPETSPEPFVFPTNSQLTTDEKATQSIATTLNRVYAGGASVLPAGHAWPAALAMRGTTVIAPGGRTIARLPAGYVARYERSSDGTSYHLAINYRDAAELATYTSNVNGYSWRCIATDTNCTPAG